jgi:hypothetical protein
MFELLYTSKVAAPLRVRELDTLLERARAANAAAGVTGVLVKHDRTFYQLLEGPEAAVRAVFDRVRRDARHTDVRVLWSGAIRTRSFAGTAMDYRKLGWGDAHAGLRALEPTGPGGSAGAALALGLSADAPTLPEFDRLAA